MIRAAFLLAGKDLRLWVRDRAALVLGLIVPIALAGIMGAAMGAFGGGQGSLGRVDLAVLDEDQSDASAALLAEIGAAGGLAPNQKGHPRERVAKGRDPLGLLIPAGYAAALERGEVPRLVLYRDASKQVELQIAIASLVPALLRAGGEPLARAAMLGSLEVLGVPAEVRPMAEAVVTDTWERMSDLTDGAPRAAAGGERSLDLGTALELLGVGVEDVAGATRGAEASRIGMRAHAVAGTAVMMLLFGLAACGGTLIEERDQGTLARLLQAPISPAAVLAGKFGFTLVVGLAQLAVLFAFGSLVFDLPLLRAPVALLATSLAVAGASTGFGLLLGTLCRTRKQLEGLSTLVILVMSALGGSWWPLAILPEWFRRLGHLTLNAWAMDAFQGIFWYGKDLAEILPELGVLALIGLGTSCLAVHFWRRRFARA